MYDQHRPSAEISEQSLRIRKEHLMDEISRAGSPTPRAILRMPAMVVALSVVLVGGLAATAVAIGTAVSRDENGVTIVDTEHLEPMYDGVVITQEALARLVADGKATIAINSPELACQGVTLYVDTQAEADAYDRQYRARAESSAEPLGECEQS